MNVRKHPSGDRQLAEKGGRRFAYGRTGERSPLWIPVADNPDTKRMNRILSAIVVGVERADFPFESDVEREFWDRLIPQVGAIRANGHTVAITNE